MAASRGAVHRSVVVGALVTVSVMILIAAAKNFGGADPVLVAAGDIACDPASGSFRNGVGTATACRQMYTSDLAVAAAPSAVAILGDGAYKCGSLEAYTQSYGPSWGRLYDVTHPAPGNHEYETAASDPHTGCDASNSGAAGYFEYFGERAGERGKGYYSYDVGAWHVVVLNSNCTASGGCAATSPQGRWLREDLAAHRAACTMAYWHEPLAVSGSRDALKVRPFWDALYDAGADVVLNGHVHFYERLKPMDPTGAVDPVRGIRTFVVGSGGASHEAAPTSVTANSETLNADTFGVLKMTLRESGYDWEFLPEGGGSYTDRGSAECHGTGTATSPTQRSSS